MDDQQVKAQAAAQRTDSLARISPPVAELCRAMNARDYQAVGDQLAADAVWHIVGRKDRFPFGGPQQKTQFIEGLKTSLSGFESFNFDVVSWAANGDLVFAEARASGRTAGGATYSNHYLMRFILRDGRITDVLEHYDPFEALAFVEQLTGVI